MKILIITDTWHPQINGVVRTYENLARVLRAAGHKVKVVGPLDFPARYPLVGYPEIRLVLFASRRLAKIIEEYAPEGLHIATEGPLGWAARRYALRKGIPFTSCYHTNFPDYITSRIPSFLMVLSSPLKRLAVSVLKKFHDPAQAVFAATPSLLNTLKHWGLKAAILPMTRGVDTSVFHTGDGTFFPSVPRPIALYVGRIAVEKNLEGFLNMPWEGTKVVVGDGPQKTLFEEKYPLVFFAGPHNGETLAEHYRSADVFVFPSKTDTFGMVLIEALACGLPIAAYPTSGPIDIITDETLGCLTDDLQTAAKRALSTQGQKKARSEHVKKHYSWELAAQQFLSGFFVNAPSASLCGGDEVLQPYKRYGGMRD